MLQHTQGQNPPDFDDAFNLHDGRWHTDAGPLSALIDGDTTRRMQEAGQSGAQAVQRPADAA